jgi:hypothetical protein
VNWAAGSLAVGGCSTGQPSKPSQKGETVPDLLAAVENWIAHLPDDEFRALIARTREPDKLLPDDVERKLVT